MLPLRSTATPSAWPDDPPPKNVENMTDPSPVNLARRGVGYIEDATVVWYAFLSGRSADVDSPTIMVFPCGSSVLPKQLSSPLPPKNVEKTRAPEAVSLVTKQSCPPPMLGCMAFFSGKSFDHVVALNVA